MYFSGTLSLASMNAWLSHQSNLNQKKSKNFYLYVIWLVLVSQGTKSKQTKNLKKLLVWCRERAKKTVIKLN